MSPDWASVQLPGIGPGTTALVTGGTGAIGCEIARALVQLGATVGIAGRSADRTAEVAEGLANEGSHGSAVPIVADVVDLAVMRAAVAELVGDDGGLDVLVNSAAVGTVAKPIAEVTEDEIDAVLAVNVKGALLAAIACSPHLERSRGCVVNIASIGAYGAHPGHAIYGATKAAVLRLTKQLAVDLGPSGIRSNSVSPGQTPTRIRGWDEEPGVAPVETDSRVIGADVIPLGRRGELADYVGPVLFLASDLARYVNGIDIPVEGGVLAKL